MDKQQNDYLKNHKNSSLKIGQKVKLLRKAENYEKGWGNSWNLFMTKNVGKIGIITHDDGEYGFVVDFGNTYYYSYPYFVLINLRIVKIKKLL